MTEQQSQMYFASDPNTKHDEHLVDYRVEGINLKFTTDAGVFSKIRIDYGSGVLIKAIHGLKIPDGDILDVGTGYGPIGLFAAKFWPNRNIDMVDVNERALNLAKRNAQLNSISNINIYTSDIYAHVDNKKEFALILTNPPIRAGKRIVDQILVDAKKHLAKDGVIVAIIQKKQGAPSAKKLMTATYGNCKILTRDKGYYLLASKNI